MTKPSFLHAGPILATARLTLRPWRAADRAPWAAMNDDAEVMRYLPKHLTRAEADEIVDRYAAHFEAKGFGFWAVEETATGTFIGMVGLFSPPAQLPFAPATEIGWRLARPAWGKGYATEAARACLAFAFDTLGLDEVVSFTVPSNARSRGVMAKIGMTRDLEGDFEHVRVPVGHPLRPHVLYRIRRPT